MKISHFVMGFLAVPFLAVPFLLDSHAQAFPNMVGTWTGTVQVISSGDIEEDRLDRGGVMITEVALELIIDAQDGETFIGRSRNAASPASNPGAHVWGSIRSNGEEAIFITETGGRGQLWFEDDSEFEYCFTNLEEGSITSYCARLSKE